MCTAVTCVYGPAIPHTHYVLLYHAARGTTLRGVLSSLLALLQLLWLVPYEARYSTLHPFSRPSQQHQLIHSSAPHHQVPVLQAHLPEGLALGAWIGGTQRLAGFVLTIIFVSCLRCVRLPNRVTMTLVLALSLAAAIALASNWPLLAQFPPKAGREWTPPQLPAVSHCLPAIVCQPYSQTHTPYNRTFCCHCLGCLMCCWPGVVAAWPCSVECSLACPHCIRHGGWYVSCLTHQHTLGSCCSPPRHVVPPPLLHQLLVKASAHW